MRICKNNNKKTVFLTWYDNFKYKIIFFKLFNISVSL